MTREDWKIAQLGSSWALVAIRPFRAYVAGGVSTGSCAAAYHHSLMPLIGHAQLAQLVTVKHQPE